MVGYVGKGSEHLIRSVLAPRFEAEHAQDRFDEALAIYQAEYAKINGLHTRLYPDVEAGLAALRDAGLKLAVRHQQAASLRRSNCWNNTGSRNISASCSAATVCRKSRTRCPCSRPPRNWASNRAPRWPSAIRGKRRAGGPRGVASTLTVPYGYNHGKLYKQ